MNNSYVLMAIILTIIAGLSTAIGGAIGLIGNIKNKKFLGGALSLSAGVMVYVSMIEIMPHATHIIEHDNTEQLARIVVGFSFVIGMLLMVFIDKLTIKHTKHNCSEHKFEKKANLMRMGKITAIAIAIHNFPEGLATFTSVLADPKVGICIALAIAIHNIPEGIAVSAPIYYATGNKKQAFKWAFLSGLSEPLAAIIGYIFLKPFLNDAVMGIVLGVVAGIMVFISISELLPTAKKYTNSKVVNLSFILGTAIMAISLMFGGHSH